jgi:hypothetical protein
MSLAHKLHSFPPKHLQLKTFKGTRLLESYGGMGFAVRPLGADEGAC